MDPEGSVPHPATCPYPERLYCYCHVNFWRWRMACHFIHFVYFSPYYILTFNTPRFGGGIDPRLPGLLFPKTDVTTLTEHGDWSLISARSIFRWQCNACLTRRTPNSGHCIHYHKRTALCCYSTWQVSVEPKTLWPSGLTACVPQSAGDAGVQRPRPPFVIMWTGMCVPCAVLMGKLFVSASWKQRHSSDHSSARC